jgi:hypothetical protein
MAHKDIPPAAATTSGMPDPPAAREGGKELVKGSKKTTQVNDAPTSTRATRTRSRSRGVPVLFIYLFSSNRLTYVSQKMT